MNKKFEIIVESYFNGNISWVKSEVKKLSKQARKELFIYFYLTPNDYEELKEKKI
jgi:hypothetical protein